MARSACERDLSGPVNIHQDDVTAGSVRRGHEDFLIETFVGESDRIDEDTAGTNVAETGDMNTGTTKTLTIDLAPGHYAFV